MKQIKDVYRDHQNPQRDLTDLSRFDATQITSDLQKASSDIGFVLTNASYDIFRAVWNSDVIHKKGLYLFGKPGIGKTFTFNAIRRWETMTRRANPIMNININTMEDGYRINGAEYIAEIVQYPRVAFHNFGFQNDQLPDFGSKRSLFIDVIDQRYDIYQMGRNTRTFITSNFDGHEVSKYGSVFLRRVAEMMKYKEL